MDFYIKTADFRAYTVTVCEKCPNETKLKCTGCNYARYCSSKCQKADWNEHKLECRKIQEEGVITINLSLEQYVDRLKNNPVFWEALLGQLLPSYAQKYQEDLQDLLERTKRWISVRTILEKPDSLRCSVCKNDIAPFICSGCKNIRYCSPKCQKLDWIQHRRYCKTIQDGGEQPLGLSLEEYVHQLLTDPEFRKSVIGNKTPEEAKSEIEDAISLNNLVREFITIDFRRNVLDDKSPEDVEKLLKAFPELRDLLRRWDAVE